MKPHGATAAIIAVIFSIIGSVNVRAESPSTGNSPSTQNGQARWRELMSQAVGSLRQHALGEAELYCREAMKTAANFSPHGNYLATNLVLLAEIQRRQDQPGQAEQSLKAAVDESEKNFGPDHPGMIMPVETLANFYYYAQNRPGLALPLCERLVRLVETNAPADSAELLKRVRAVATILREQQHYALAEPHYQRILALAEKTPDALTATLLKTADFYRVWGKWERAEALCQRALTIVETAARTNDTPRAQMDLAVSFYGLAQIYRDGGKAVAAEPLYRRSLALTEKIIAHDNMELIPPLTGLAGALSDQGKTAEAETLYQRALAIEPSQPKPDVAGQYAALLAKLNRPDEAKVLLQDHQWRDLMHNSSLALKQSTAGESKRLCDEALQLAATFGPHDTRFAQSQVQLANVYRNMGQFVLAEQTLEAAITNCEKAVGPEHPDLAIPLESLVNLYSFGTVQPEKILPLDRRLLDIAQKKSGRNDAEVAFRARNLADIYQGMGKFSNAEPFYQQALTLTETNPAEYPDHLLSAANFYRAWGRYDEAERLANQLVRLREKSLPAATNRETDAKLDLAVAIDALGEVQLAGKKPAQAESSYRRSLALLESFSNADNPDLAPRLCALGDALRAQNKFSEAGRQYDRAVHLIGKNAGLNADELADVLEKYAVLRKDMNQPAEAESLLARAKKIRRPAVATEH